MSGSKQTSGYYTILSYSCMSQMRTHNIFWLKAYTHCQMADCICLYPFLLVPVSWTSAIMWHMFADLKEEADCREIQVRADSLAAELQRTREKCLPN